MLPKRFFSASVGFVNVSPAMRKIIVEHSKIPQQARSLRNIYESGLVPLPLSPSLSLSLFILLSHTLLYKKHPTAETILKDALFLKDELPVRLAHRLIELESLPDGLSEMPSVKIVKDWYTRSFLDIHGFPTPTLENTMKAGPFSACLQGIKHRHDDTVQMIANGLKEMKEFMQKEQKSSSSNSYQLISQPVGDFLDRFYMSRVGIRVLMGQHIAMVDGSSEKGTLPAHRPV